MEAKLHHFAYNIRPGTLELVLELLEKLGCTQSYRKGNARWCMIEQKPVPVDIQIIETGDSPVPIGKKVNSHIAFLSDNPEEVVSKIKRWAQSRNVEFRQGRWSDSELWFDLPDMFTNFVVEIMHSQTVK